MDTTARPDSDALGTDCPVIWMDASYNSNPPGSDGQPLSCAQSSQLVDSPANCSSACSDDVLSSIKNSNPAGSDGQSSATRRMHHFHITLVWLMEKLQHFFIWVKQLLRIDPQDQRLRQVKDGDIEQGGCLNGDPMGPRPAFELEPQRDGDSCHTFLPNISNDSVERYSVESESVLELPRPDHSERPSCETHF